MDLFKKNFKVQYKVHKFDAIYFWYLKLCVEYFGNYFNRKYFKHDVLLWYHNVFTHGTNVGEASNAQLLQHRPAYGLVVEGMDHHGLFVVVILHYIFKDPSFPPTLSPSPQKNILHLMMVLYMYIKLKQHPVATRRVTFRISIVRFQPNPVQSLAHLFFFIYVILPPTIQTTRKKNLYQLIMGKHNDKYYFTKLKKIA